jgi:GNAT superfamily N-acetyltransferase
MEIRDARVEDAQAACEVMQRSIVELCTADHRHKPAILGRWLANKTPENFVSWINQAGHTLMVATEGDSILAVGLVTHAGRITLNYVSPDVRFRGVSRALLAALEARAAEHGNAEVTLNSTETARRFYLAARYFEDGPPASLFGTQAGYSMKKWLPPLPS